MYAIIKNDQIIDFPIYDLKKMFPHISFPTTIKDENLPDGIVKVYTKQPPIIDNHTHKLVVQPPKFDIEQKRWIVEYLSQEFTESEKIQRTERLKQSIIEQRNTLLLQSDWTQVADAPVDRNAWAEYRQQLRDITVQPGYPFEVVWPTAPQN